MKYREKNGKWIFEKDGVFFALTKEQVVMMRNLCNVILGEHTMVLTDDTKNWLATPIDD